MTLELEDELGNTNKYYFLLEIIDSTLPMLHEEIEDDWAPELTCDEDFQGEIVELTENGLMTIEFSKTFLPFQNLSEINSTVIDIYVKPAKNRDLWDDKWDPCTVNLTWYAVSMEDRTLVIQIDFDAPHEISPLLQQDTLMFAILDDGMSIFKTYLQERFLCERRRVIKSRIKKQLGDVDLFQEVVEGTSDGLMVLLVIAILLNFFDVSGCMDYMIALIRYLQIVLHLPLMKVVLPACMIFANKCLIQVAMFDLFDPEWTTDYIYEYDDEKVQLF